MKKISVIAISVVLLFMLTASASADVRRGDRGEDVEEIQTLLFQMGWLFEVPDGIFGPHTEQAVLNYQEYSGLTQDGVVDKATYDRMWEDWHYLFYDDGTPHNHGEDWDGDGILEVEPDDESMALLHNFPQPDADPPEAESEANPAVPEEREEGTQTQENETKPSVPENREGLVQTQEIETEPAVSGEREGQQQTQEIETKPAVSEEREGLMWTQKTETDPLKETEGSKPLQTGKPESVQTIETEPVETEAFTETMQEESGTEEIAETETEELTEPEPGETETEELTETETEELTEPEPEETETEPEETEAEETESEKITETETEKPGQPERWNLGKVLQVLESAPEQLMDSVSSIKDQFGFGRK